MKWVAWLVAFSLGSLLPASGSNTTVVKVFCSTLFFAEAARSLLDRNVEVQVMPAGLWNTPETSQWLVANAVVILGTSQHQLRRDLQMLKRPDVQCVLLKDNACLLIPANYLKLVQNLEPPLSKVFPEYEAFFKERMKELQEQVTTAESEILAQARAKQIIDTPCWSADPVVPFIRWLGYRVEGTFGVLSQEQIQKIQSQLLKNANPVLVIGVADAKDGGEFSRLVEGNRARSVAVNTEPIVASETSETPGWRRLLDDNIRVLLAYQP